MTSPIPKYGKSLRNVGKPWVKLSLTPLGKNVHFTLGDLNFREQNELPSRIGINGEATPKNTDIPRDNAARKKWAAAFDKSTEHYQPEHTRIGHNPRATEHKYLIASRNDRIYSSLLPWQLINVRVKTLCVTDVAKARSICGSDHVPVASQITLKQQRNHNDRPIPKWLAQHQVFKETLEKSLEGFDPDANPDPFEAILEVKTRIRCASKKAIKMIMARKANTTEEKMQVVLQASRAITYNLASVAQHVKRGFPDLGKHIAIDEDGRVYLSSPAAFHQMAQEIASAQSRSEETRNSELTRRPKSGRAAQIQRWNQLWSPFSRRVVNVAIVRADGTVANSPEDKAMELKKFWGSVFSDKAIDVDEAATFLQSFAVKLAIPEHAIPTVAAIQAFLRKAKHSAPGPDGIPYRCWHFTGKKSAKTILRAMIAMMSGRKPPQGFSDSWSIFLPKGAQDDDTAASVQRSGECTRPLGLKNTDNKTIAGAVNNSIAQKVSEWADDQQNGFTIGRQGVNNPVTLDARARAADHLAASDANLPIALHPALLFFDFCAAVPSVAHALIFLVLEAIGLPRGLTNYFKSLYADNNCYGCFDGRLIFLYVIKSGIIQGCPASGTIFVLFSRPVLETSQSLLDWFGLSRFRR